MSEPRTDLTTDNGKKGQGMSISTEEMTKLQDEIKGLEVGQATQAATQAAAHAGTWSTMLAGAAGLVVGMFLGISIIRSAQR
jgi:hypothetical protein